MLKVNSGSFVPHIRPYTMENSNKIYQVNFHGQIILFSENPFSGVDISTRLCMTACVTCVMLSRPSGVDISYLRDVNMRYPHRLGFDHATQAILR